MSYLERKRYDLYRVVGCRCHSTRRQDDETWAFAAVGFQTLDGWILQSWHKVKKCDMGHEHIIEEWSRAMAQILFEVNKIKSKSPDAPKKVISELKRKVGKRKTIKPWPYDR